MYLLAFHFVSDCVPACF
uniref:Uncharacterized protein n=1 Tax=Anguilla anguilla TaxID=7936 RepID=A0A0E9W883_ANGAN